MQSQMQKNMQITWKLVLYSAFWWLGVPKKNRGPSWGVPMVKDSVHLVHLGAQFCTLVPFGSQFLICIGFQEPSPIVRFPMMIRMRDNGRAVLGDIS